MAVPVATLAKLAAAALSDEDTRRKLGWIVAAICSPLILTLALICSLLSGSAEHNNSAILLCFHGGDTAIKPITPEREQELVAKLVDFLSSRYDAGNLYDILRHGLGMDHSDMEALGFQLRDYYEEV